MTTPNRDYTHEAPTFDMPMHVFMKRLVDQYLDDDQEGLNMSRQLIRLLAVNAAVGTGEGKQVKILETGKNISIRDAMKDMDKQQSERFIDELFEAITPHLANQRIQLNHLKEKIESDDYSGDPILETVKAMAGDKDEFKTQMDLVFSTLEIQSQKLTWVDDFKQTITSNINFSMEVLKDGESNNGRKAKP